VEVKAAVVDDTQCGIAKVGETKSKVHDVLVVRPFGAGNEILVDR
jgi:hypothetical protein